MKGWVFSVDLLIPQLNAPMENLNTAWLPLPNWGGLVHFEYVMDIPLNMVSFQIK